MIPFLTSGCVGLPAARDVSTMSLNLTGVPPYPIASLTGDSDMGPGRTARAALPPSEFCYDIMAIVCAIVIPVMVPIAAIIGATAKTTQKLPLEQVIELNQVTSNVGRGLNLSASFRAALEAEAQRRGVTLTTANAAAEIFIDPRRLSWDIRTGNKVAVSMDIDISVQRDGEEDSSDLTYRSDAAQVDYWVADNGRPIRESLDEVMAGASRAVWDRILGEE
jgi:hypothetical protein